MSATNAEVFARCADSYGIDCDGIGGFWAEVDADEIDVSCPWCEGATGST